MLDDVGRALADFHGAVADFVAPEPVRGQLPGVASDPVCHHDLAPYNVVVSGAGRLVGIIDWDLAGPGSHRGDLAFVAWQWVPLWHPAALADAIPSGPLDTGRRLGVLLDAYGLEERAGFVSAVIARARDQVEGLAARAAAGVPAYVAIAREGHIEAMRRNVAYLRARGGPAGARRCGRARQQERRVHFLTDSSRETTLQGCLPGSRRARTPRSACARSPTSRPCGRWPIRCGWPSSRP